jgi:hypothetical protein
VTAADQLRARLIRPDARSATQFDPHVVLNEAQVEALADALATLGHARSALRDTGSHQNAEFCEKALARAAAALGDTQEEAD